MTEAALPDRSIQLAPLSALVELGHVVRAAIAIVIAACMYLGTDSPIFRGEPTSTGNLLPYQALIADRPTTEQRTFRELQEGLLEAETRRSQNGSWPTVEELAADGVPPFALDPTAKVGPYRWRLVTSDYFVNYVGVSERPEDPAWLLWITEPIPGAPPDLARPDQEHHPLIDGTMLHVATWVRTDGQPVREGIRQMPANEGWTQLYAVQPTLAPSVASPAG